MKGIRIILGEKLNISCLLKLCIIKKPGALNTIGKNRRDWNNIKIEELIKSMNETYKEYDDVWS